MAEKYAFLRLNLKYFVRFTVAFIFIILVQYFDYFAAIVVCFCIMAMKFFHLPTEIVLGQITTFN